MQNRGVPGYLENGKCCIVLQKEKKRVAFALYTGSKADMQSPIWLNEQPQMLVLGEVLQDSVFNLSCSKYGLQANIVKLNENMC